MTDFIDMEDKKNKNAVQRKLKEALKKIEQEFKLEILAILDYLNCQDKD